MERLLSILLVEDDPDVCKKFKAEIDEALNMSLIHTTNSSYHALELTKDYQPDVVILDLELNLGSGNGFHFLNQLKTLEPPISPYILVVTNNSSSTTYQLARELGADFIMYKHQKDYSEQKVIEFLEMMRSVIHSGNHTSDLLSATSETPTQKKQRLRRIISKELNQVGINPKSVGFQYLTEAILITLDDVQPNIALIVSKKFNKTSASVVRGMQNAINSAWRTADIDDLLLHYNAKVNPSTGVPTVTEFICYYANKIRNEH